MAVKSDEHWARYCLRFERELMQRIDDARIEKDPYMTRTHYIADILRRHLDSLEKKRKRYEEIDE